MLNLNKVISSGKKIKFKPSKHPNLRTTYIVPNCRAKYSTEPF